MFFSLVTSTLLNKTGADVVFWPREKWNSLATYSMAMVLWSSLGPPGGLVDLRRHALRFKVSKAMQRLCCNPSRWCFHSMSLRACMFGEPWRAAWGGARHPWACKAYWDNAGGPWKEPELTLDCPYCLLGMPAIPQAMPGIPWEGPYGHRPQLYDKRHCQFSRVHN